MQIVSKQQIKDDQWLPDEALQFISVVMPEGASVLSHCTAIESDGSLPFHRHRRTTEAAYGSPRGCSRHRAMPTILHGCDTYVSHATPCPRGTPFKVRG